MPDANGNIKGISVPELPWHEDALEEQPEDPNDCMICPYRCDDFCAEYPECLS